MSRRKLEDDCKKEIQLYKNHPEKLEEIKKIQLKKVKDFDLFILNELNKKMIQQQHVLVEVFQLLKLLESISWYFADI